MAQILSPAEAMDRVLAHAVALEATEVVALDAAHGRRLANERRAASPWPSTDRSAMDGFACATAGRGVAAQASYRVVGEALAGHPFDRELAAGQAVRIMTGAVVPQGADVVVKVEDVAEGYGAVGDAITVRVAVACGANIRVRGSEIAVGDLLLERGSRIRAAEIGALAVLGEALVEVFRRPKVAILSTGDEVVPIDEEPLPHQVRDSNAWALAAQVRQAGGEALRLGIAADEPAALRARLEAGLRDADVLLTIGGVSMGTHDLVHGALREFGVREIFHGVSIKPGKPLFFGVTEIDGAPRFVFGLPGNPASACTTFDLFVRELLLRLGGAPVRPGRAPLTLPLVGESFAKNWRSQAIPARRVVSNGELAAALCAGRPSGDPFGLCDGDGYVLVAGGADPDAVRRAEFVPYDIEGP